MAVIDTADTTVEKRNDIQGPVIISQDVCPKCGDKSTKVPQTYKSTFIRNHKLTMLSALTVTIVIMIILSMTYLTFQTSTKCSQTVLDSEKPSSGAGEGLRMILRDEWLARPAAEPLDELELPVHQVIIAHTATDSCSSQAQCSYRTKILQDFHMESRDFGDIAYNFLVGGDGAVYEGRGWNFKGAHTKGYNEDSICFAFIGTFEQEAPPQNQLNATKLIIQEGVRQHKIVKDYKLYGARQLMGSQSPGLALYEIIQKWPNWSSK